MVTGARRIPRSVCVCVCVCVCVITPAVPLAATMVEEGASQCEDVADSCKQLGGRLDPHDGVASIVAEAACLLARSLAFLPLLACLVA